MAFNEAFKRKYGTSGGAINRAIREEIPGMNAVLDALEQLSMARQYAHGELRRLLQKIEDGYVRARAAAKSLIHLQYDVRRGEQSYDWDE